MIAKVLLVLAAGSVASYASDPVGVYARVDRVAMQPNETKPETIQIWGVFVVAKPGDGSTYEAPAKGYFFCKLPERGEQTALAEWADLKSVAGTKQLVAFGSRYQWKARIRKAGEKPESPDPYTTGVGLTKVRGRTDYEPVRALLEFKD